MVVFGIDIQIKPMPDDAALLHSKKFRFGAKFLDWMPRGNSMTVP